jgi:hypothetical protein
MKDKSNVELYHILRTGTDEEAQAAEEELGWRNKEMRRVAMKVAIPAIMCRNFSHGLGQAVRKKLKGSLHEVQPMPGPEFDSLTPGESRDLLVSQLYILGDDGNFYRVSTREHAAIEFKVIDGMRVSFETPAKSKGKHLWAYNVKKV